MKKSMMMLKTMMKMKRVKRNNPLPFFCNEVFNTNIKDKFILFEIDEFPKNHCKQ